MEIFEKLSKVGKTRIINDLTVQLTLYHKHFFHQSPVYVHVVNRECTSFYVCGCC